MIFGLFDWYFCEKSMLVRYFKLFSETLKREVKCVVYLPIIDESVVELPIIIVNDGQDLRKMQMGKILQQEWHTEPLKVFGLVGIYSNFMRLFEYGVSYQPDFLNRGNLAQHYGIFLTQEFLPFLQQKAVNVKYKTVAIAGFSLGGLSAFDLGWNYPNLFPNIGVFSGSLWWRSKAFEKDNPDDNRIAHKLVLDCTEPPKLNFWFQAGTKDECSDRNQNGIIDSIDDTLDLIASLQKCGYSLPNNVGYHEIQNGKHDLSTWAKAWPFFFKWLKSFL